MTWAVDVGIVPVVGGVLNVGRGDGDTAFPLFGGLVDGAILKELGIALLCLTLGDGCGEGCLRARLDGGAGEAKGISCLSMVDVTDGTCLD